MSNKFIVALLLLLTVSAFKIRKIKDKVASIPANNYPIRAVYIDRITSWYGMSVAACLGLPGYAAPHDYNYIIFAFWSCKNPPEDIALVWQNISMYLGETNPFGTTDSQVQIGMKKKYNDAGIKIMVSAFGDS